MSQPLQPSAQSIYSSPHLPSSTLSWFSFSPYATPGAGSQPPGKPRPANVTNHSGSFSFRHRLFGDQPFAGTHVKPATETPSPGSRNTIGPRASPSGAGASSSS